MGPAGEPMSTPELISDRYAIEAELGSGATATVYRALDRVLQRQVALKVIAPAHTNDPDFSERFDQEARLAARLDHPNIVTVHDVGTTADGRGYISMRLLEGESLDRIIAKRAPLPPAETGSVITQLASALDYTHGQGMVHRDVKPSNVVVDPGGRATLTDFGIARALDSARLTMTGLTVGTPRYMSPEQVRGEDLTAATDVYSLAVIAYEMLAGRAPFEGQGTGLMFKIVHEDPPDVTAVNPGIPEAIATSLRRALAKDPASRWPSAGAFAAALEQGIAGAGDAGTGAETVVSPASGESARTAIASTPTSATTALHPGLPGGAPGAGTQPAAPALGEGAKLVIRVPGQPAREYELEERPVNIGRSSENDIPIDSGYVSRRHGRIEPADGSWTLVNLGGSNPMMVGDDAVAGSHTLASGDVIRIADVAIEFWQWGGDGGATQVLAAAAAGGAGGAAIATGAAAGGGGFGGRGLLFAGIGGAIAVGAIVAGVFAFAGGGGDDDDGRLVGGDPTETPTEEAASPTVTEPPTVPPETVHIEYIVDHSGSMLGLIDGKTKLAIAHDVLDQKLAELPPGVNLGMRVYGHRIPWQQTEESCEDIELVVPIDAGGGERIVRTLPTLDALGMTPISASLKLAADDFVFEQSRRNSVVLISDGLETCGEEPADVIRGLQEFGIDFSLEVIGLDVDDEAREQLQALADAAGGTYHDANNEAELAEALGAANAAVLAAEGDGNGDGGVGAAGAGATATAEANASATAAAAATATAEGPKGATATALAGSATTAPRATSTNTPLPGATATPTSPATNTPTATATHTQTPTHTPTPTPTSTPTPTPTPEPVWVNITHQGWVEVSSTFENNFAAYGLQYATDGSTATSWFSWGPTNGATWYTWDAGQTEVFVEIDVFGNANHPQFPTGFGFESVLAQIYDEFGNLVWEDSRSLAGTPDPDVFFAPPAVEGQYIQLLFYGSEDLNCGGFSEFVVWALQ